MNIPKIQLSQKPTYVKCAQDIDFHVLFQKIEEQSENCFLLESLGEEGHTSRYSIIGFDPQHILRARENELIIDNKVYSHAELVSASPLEQKETLKRVQGDNFFNPYFALQEIVPQHAIARRYAGGLIGILSYDAMNYFETSLHVKANPHFDQFSFGVYTDGLVLDKATQEIIYFFYEDNRMKIVERFLRSNVQLKDVTVQFIRDELTKEEHTEHVTYVQEQIHVGNTFQCEVGFKSEYKITGDTRQIYARLRKINPSPFMYYVKFGKTKIIGASPELLFQLRDGEMETYPLAGTIRRGKTPEEDKQLARQLLNDPKEIAEHNMLVDLHRNDLGRVAEFGTVKVRSLMDIKRFSHVQHISSEIAGIIRQGEDMFSALASNFPAGTLTGAPKIESMKIIDHLEKSGRGPYGGALGHFGFNGDCTFAIPIRTLFIHDDYAYTQTCGGIVADSDPEKEYEEIMRKSQAMREVLNA